MKYRYQGTIFGFLKIRWRRRSPTWILFLIRNVRLRLTASEMSCDHPHCPWKLKLRIGPAPTFSLSEKKYPWLPGVRLTVCSTLKPAGIWELGSWKLQYGSYVWVGGLGRTQTPRGLATCDLDSPEYSTRIATNIGPRRHERTFKPIFRREISKN